MIRLIFDPLLSIDQPKLNRMVAKLAPLQCKTKIEPSGRCQIFIETDMLADSLAYALGVSNHTYCKGCNSLHFKSAIEPFRCMCGAYLNKGK